MKRGAFIFAASVAAGAFATWHYLAKRGQAGVASAPVDELHPAGPRGAVVGGKSSVGDVTSNVAVNIISDPYVAAWQYTGPDQTVDPAEAGSGITSAFMLNGMVVMASGRFALQSPGGWGSDPGFAPYDGYKRGVLAGDWTRTLVPSGVPFADPFQDLGFNPAH